MALGKTLEIVALTLDQAAEHPLGDPAGSAIVAAAHDDNRTARGNSMDTEEWVEVTVTRWRGSPAESEARLFRHRT